MFRNVTIRLILIYCLCLTFLSIDNKSSVNAIAWPECGEFVFPKDDINLSAEEKQFRRKLPTLFDSYDCGNTTDIESTLKSLEKFNVPFVAERKKQLAKQTLSPILDISDRIENDGYPAQVHKIVTSDGYILQLHRIGNDTSLSTADVESRVPVFLMHGLLETASSWIALGPEHSLAYLLYDMGYDVWMGNARGTRPSQGHTYLNATDGAHSKKYWSFSLHEIAIYDCPAFIDYILQKTNHTQLHYVGYSQGTTLFFILTSTLPEYNSKIRSMVAMAPAVRMTNSQHTFLNILSKYYTLIKKVLDYYKIYSIDYGNRALRWLAEFACKKIENKSPFVCQFLLFFLDSNQINCTTLPRIVHSIPNSASVLQLFHYAQLKISGVFRPYRYDDNATNQLIYGKPLPDPYNLTQTSVPITIMYSRSDEVSNVTDVLYLYAQLTNVTTELYQLPIKDFKHIDFIYSRFVRQFVNDKVIDALKLADQYSSLEHFIDSNR